MPRVYANNMRVLAEAAFLIIEGIIAETAKENGIEVKPFTKRKQRVKRLAEAIGEIMFDNGEA